MRSLPVGTGSNQISASGRLFSTSAARQADFSHVVSEFLVGVLLFIFVYIFPSCFLLIFL